MWEEFTQTFELKNENTKQKIAKQLILSDKDYNNINMQLLIYHHTQPFYKMIANNTPNERILCPNKNYLDTALKNIILRNIKFTSIPENITQENIKFTTWLHQENVLSNEEFNKIIPILTAYHLEQKISTTNTTNKKHKI